jgi:hypothetical protein
MAITAYGEGGCGSNPFANGRKTGLTRFSVHLLLRPQDALERKLHNLVCSGQLDLKTAQHEIASNWIDAYQKYIAKSPPPARLTPETKAVPAASNAGDVWVNTRSGKYWKPGSRYYGKTKEGEFMPELDALDRGFTPAGGTGE